MHKKWASRNAHESDIVRSKRPKSGRTFKGLVYNSRKSPNAHGTNNVLRWRTVENAIKMVLLIWMDSYTTSKRHETLTWQKRLRGKPTESGEMRWNGALNLKGLVYQNGARSSPHPCLPTHSPSKAAYTSDQLVLLLSLSYKCERSTVRSSKWHPSVLQIFDLCSTCGVVLQIVLA